MVREEFEAKRASGIEILEDFAWGTHVCSFYDSKKDLLEILVPYFKAGIDANEYCLWITPDGESAVEAFEALQKAVPRLTEYISAKKVEILPVTPGSIYNTSCSTHAIIDHWFEQLKAAESRGMAGVRIHDCNTSINPAVSKKFIEYENDLQLSVANKKIIVLCTYPLSKCDENTFIDLAQIHGHIITRKDGRWEIPGHHEESKGKDIPTQNNHSQKQLEDSINKSGNNQSGVGQRSVANNELPGVGTGICFKAFFENANDGILIIEKDRGNIIDINSKAVAITGYQREELLHKNISTIFSPVNGILQSGSDEKYSYLSADGDRLQLEIIHKNGSVVCVNVNTGITGIAGREFILFFFHKSERHNIVEHSMLQSESNYRYLFENNPASIYIWDPFTLKIIEVNNTALEMYGYTREEFLKLSTLNLRPPEDLPKYFDFLKFVQSDGDLSLKAGIWKHVKKNGEVIFVEITSHKIQYAGTPAVLSMNINITEKVLLERRFEEERIHKQNEITDAVFFAEERERQEIGRELHDNVNQLLATARLYLGITKNDDPKVLQNVRQADHLVEIAINEIRNLSHAMIAPMLEKSGLINALKYLMDSIARGSGLHFQFNVSGIEEEKMPDKLKLTIYRIVQEQLSNIFKHAKADQVTIKLAHQRQHYLLAICDNGVGFNMEEKANGIGLMNIHTRASLFKGNVKINSAAGRGCELSVTFPEAAER
jgi:PAS domain S-box-containing protein